jgi:hypothetical protein
MSSTENKESRKRLLAKFFPRDGRVARRGRRIDSCIDAFVEAVYTQGEHAKGNWIGENPSLTQLAELPPVIVFLNEYRAKGIDSFSIMRLMTHGIETNDRVQVT